jgi:hypothetical protein
MEATRIFITPYRHDYTAGETSTVAPLSFVQTLPTCKETTT